MKLKFKFMAILAALGIVSSGFAAWNFATPTEGSASINVDIENYTSLGRIEVEPIGQYNLAQTPNALAFTATYHEDGGGVAVSELNLTYTVILNAELGNLIDFGASATGTWLSGVEKSITPVWKDGMNPTTSAAYQAIKDNLANLHMTVSFTATRKTGLEPVAPGFVAPAALPAGFEADEHGVIAYDKDKGKLQLGVVGLTSEGGTSDGVAQNFNWSTSDATRATVVDGLVTPLADGDVTITATAATLAGKGLKKAEGAAKHEFKLHITGFTVIPPDPIATTIELVLGTGVTNGMALEIGDEIEVNARVLDEKGNVMPGLVPEATLLNDESASYNSGVLKALAEDDDGLLAFSYEDLDEVEFNFTINPLPVIEPSSIRINGYMALDLKFEDPDGILVAEVLDANGNLMEEEAVTWSTPNNSVIYVAPTTGAYHINGSGTVQVKATSVTKPVISGYVTVNVAEPVIIEHTVTLVYGYGIENSSVTVVHGEAIGTLTAPEVAGYTFLRWESNNTEFLLNTPIVSDGLILTAIYTKTTYSVSFDLNGGDGSYDTQQVDPGQFATNPGTPSRTGYTFSGWFNGDTLFDFTNTPVNSALNLKAKWEIKSYTVTFDTDGGSTIASVPVNHGAKVTAPAVPTKEGFTFDGWFLNEVAYDFNSAVTGDLTLKAKWVEEEVPVRVNYVFDFTKHGMTSDSTAITNVQTFKNCIIEDNDEEISFIFNNRVYGAKAADGGGLKLGASGANTGGSLSIQTVGKIYGASFTVKSYASDDQQKILVSDKNLNITTSLFTYEIDYPEGTNSFKIESYQLAKSRFYLESLTLFVTPPVPPVALESVVISSAAGVASVEEKQTLQLSAVVYDVDGALVDNANVTWESLNEEIAEISGTGLVTAVAPGNVMIKVVAVRGSSEKEVQYALEVTARPAAAPNKVVFVGYEEVAAPKLTIPLANGIVPLQAKVLNQYEEVMTGVDLIWESSDTAVATVNNSGTVTLVVGGTTIIKVYVSGDNAPYAELELKVDESEPLILKTITISDTTLINGPTSNSYNDYSNLGLTGFEGMLLTGKQLAKNSGLAIKNGYIYNNIAFGEGISKIEVTCDGGNASGYIEVTFGSSSNPNTDKQKSSTGSKISFTATPTTDKPTFFKVDSPYSKYVIVKSIVISYWDKA